jgi:hypothetical protein
LKTLLSDDDLWDALDLVIDFDNTTFNEGVVIDSNSKEVLGDLFHENWEFVRNTGWNLVKGLMLSCIGQDENMASNSFNLASIKAKSWKNTVIPSKASPTKTKENNSLSLGNKVHSNQTITDFYSKGKNTSSEKTTDSKSITNALTLTPGNEPKSGLVDNAHPPLKLQMTNATSMVSRKRKVIVDDDDDDYDEAEVENSDDEDTDDIESNKIEEKDLQKVTQGCKTIIPLITTMFEIQELKKKVTQSEDSLVKQLHLHGLESFIRDVSSYPSTEIFDIGKHFELLCKGLSPILQLCECS